MHVQDFPIAYKEGKTNMKTPLNYESDLGFRPLEVKIGETDDFERAVKLFKMIVQKDGILNDLRMRNMGYEKPSVKKRRKAREAGNRKFTADLREAQIASGEWAKKLKRKEQKKNEKQQKRSAGKIQGTGAL